jgi:tRNA pseudouridine38-40 synthase
MDSARNHSMKMQRFKAIVTYRGTAFDGWQKQLRASTVQDSIEKVLKEIFGTQTRISASGRTDAGVHGIGQVIAFDAMTRLSPAVLQKAMNAKLGQDIKIKCVVCVRASFHPRYAAASKTYRYLIADFPSPFLVESAWYIPHQLDMKKMRVAARTLVGKHDFSAFCSAGSSAKNFVRDIYSITLRRERFTFDPALKVLAIEITGSGFLYRMARSIVGTLVNVGLGKIEPNDVVAILASRNRARAGSTAPPWALYLKHVSYRAKSEGKQ